VTCDLWVQWAVLLSDMIDFGWIERKEAPAEGASKTQQDKAWKEYKELIWKEIATIKSPKVWKNMLVAGVDHFMGDWHVAEVKASAKRRKKRVLEHIRLTFVVLNGWISPRVS
jgi:hypothetical protein